MFTYHPDFVVPVVAELVEADEYALSEFAHIFNVSVQIGKSLPYAFLRGLADFVHRYVAVHLESAQCGYKYGE